MLPTRPTRKAELVPGIASPLPDVQTLTAGLAAVLRDQGASAGSVTVLAREPNIYTSTFPSEIVTCRLSDGRKQRLFCKYGASACAPDGHRGGIAYETQVYRSVLQRCRAGTATFYGVYQEKAANRRWLILEYVDRSVRVHKKPAALPLAARWIGHFHAAQAEHGLRRPRSLLTRYDMAYYKEWAQRTFQFSGPWRPRFPWLATLCARVADWAALLLAAPATVIHGEYYPLNILLRGRRIYPIDWESAAVAAGEIDLASLTEAWPRTIARQCEQEYRQTRWPEGAPAAFEQRLAAARLYLAFRWLGDEPERSPKRGDLWYFQQLRAAGRRLELI